MRGSIAAVDEQSTDLPSTLATVLFEAVGGRGGSVERPEGRSPTGPLGLRSLRQFLYRGGRCGQVRTAVAAIHARKGVDGDLSSTCGGAAPGVRALTRLINGSRARVESAFAPDPDGVAVADRVRQALAQQGA